MTSLQTPPRPRAMVKTPSKGNLFSGLGVARTLASYLPRMVLERFFKPFDPNHSLDMDFDEEITEQEKRHLDKASFPAAILFVDVSGFTSLNEKCSKEGPSGIEKVTKHINGYFTQLINMVHKHGGDVLKFAGDALIVAFGDRACVDDLRTLTVRATQCGVEIQSDLRSYDADGIRLTLHIAVGAGTLFTFHLGGINGHWEFFPAGSVFGQISNALDKSQSGEVYLSGQAYSVIENDVVAIENNGDWLVKSIVNRLEPRAFTPSIQNILQAPATFEEDIRCYVGSGIQKRIDAGQSQWLAEMRQVSVIFVSLKGLSFQKGRETHAPAPAVGAAPPATPVPPPTAEKSQEAPKPTDEAPKPLDAANLAEPPKPSINETDVSSGDDAIAQQKPGLTKAMSHIIVNSLVRMPSADEIDIITPRALTVGGGSGVSRGIEEVVPDYKELNHVMRIVQKIIFRHDGFVRQFLVDDKGCTLIAVFGVPTQHQDDPIRAMAAALSIKNQLKGIGLKTYIGVTTGEAFCGTVGSADRQEYAVVGDIVNLSARLMVASYKGKHGILCDEKTNAMAATRFNLAPLPPITVKGKSMPIPIFIPNRTKEKDSGHGIKRSGSKGNVHRPNMSAITSQGVLHGRDAERNMLFEQIESLGSLSSFALVCEGIAGIGKTRLGEELVGMATAKFGPKAVVIGGGDSIDQDTPFLVFSHIIQELYDLTSDAKQNEQTLKTAFARIKFPDLRNDCFTYGCFLNEILGADFGQSAAANKLATDQKQKVLMMKRILLELLVLAAEEHPRVILIEDAQWIDPHSWKLLSDIVENTTSMLLFIGTRPVPHEQKDLPYHTFTGLFNTAVLKLQPLLPEHILKIIRFSYKLGGTSTSSTAGIPPEVALFLTNKAQGNPFFAKEIVKGLDSQGAISIENGVIAVVKPLSSVKIPENLKSLIMSNFDQLNPNQQMVLKVASVLGKVISLEVLEAVFPADARKSCNISEEIMKLMTDGVIAQNNQTKQRNTYLFASNLFQEVAYGMMLDSQKRELHKETACFYEREFQRTDALGPCFNQIIYHFEHAGLPEKVEYYKERMEARKRWQYAYRLVSTVEFWGRKGVLGAPSGSLADADESDAAQGDGSSDSAFQPAPVQLEEEDDEAATRRDTMKAVASPTRLDVDVVDQLAAHTPIRTMTLRREGSVEQEKDPKPQK